MLDINDDPVTIEQIELGIAERGVAGGLDRARAARRSAPACTVGVVGSGPAGMAVAAELNKLGHEVTVYERDEGAGGLMRFGVPDAKLEKWIIDRRVDGARARRASGSSATSTWAATCRPRSCASATTRS